MTNERTITTCAAGADGAGFPLSVPLSPSWVAPLRKVHPEYRMLPSDFYKFAVEHLPLVCEHIYIEYRFQICSSALDEYERQDPDLWVEWLDMLMTLDCHMTFINNLSLCIVSCFRRRRCLAETC